MVFKKKKEKGPESPRKMGPILGCNALTNYSWTSTREYHSSIRIKPNYFPQNYSQFITFLQFKIYFQGYKSIMTNRIMYFYFHFLKLIDLDLLTEKNTCRIIEKYKFRIQPNNIAFLLEYINKKINQREKKGTRFRERNNGCNDDSEAGNFLQV